MNTNLSRYIISQSTNKRPSDDEIPAAKKVKREAPASKPALSSLLKKVQHTNDKVVSSTDSGIKEKEAAPKQPAPASIVNDAPKVAQGINTAIQKKQRKIRWADSTGENLAVTQDKTEIKVAQPAQTKPKERTNRWAKKKDLSHEKEILMQARKNAQTADDKEDELNAMAMMAGGWKMPLPLEDKENPPVQVQSKELSVQAIRESTIPTVGYASESTVPIDPNLISDAEKALEILNMQPPSDIPFFAPPPAVSIPVAAPPAFPAPPTMSATPGAATMEQVLAMGLPLFLVGQNLSALQTLAAAPSLLTTFRDASGNYDQNGLINLVSTLTQQLAPTQTTQAYAGLTGVHQTYQPPPVAQPTLFTASTMTGQAPAVQSTVSRGYRGDQNLGEANLHLSGYGPTTTTEEIVALFAPYVHVYEVVSKGNFSFVNTRDPEGAKQAREALNGSLLGGMPCRINMATRKIKTDLTAVINPAAPGDLSALPRNGLGQVDYSAVKDDRGNAATKNLFVAGWGPGTTEQQLRDLVAPYATVISVSLKSTFAFVNTTDRDAAVLARQSLSGTMLNGGILRINFAKESGRLGTSFGDSAYGPAGATAAAATGVTSYGTRFR